MEKENSKLTQLNNQLADENAKLEVAVVITKEKLQKTIEEKKELKAKVTE